MAERETVDDVVGQHHRSAAATKWEGESAPWSSSTSTGVVRDPPVLARLDPAGRAVTVGQLQRSAGNAAVQHLLAPLGPDRATVGNLALRRPYRAPRRYRAGGTFVQRKVSTDLDEMAEAGGSQAQSDEQREANQGTQPPAMRVSNVADVGAAQALVGQLESWRAPMQEGAGAGGAFTVSENRVTPAKMAANEQAVSALDDYLITAGEQSRTLGSFQDGLQKARVDYERLNAQVTHLTVTNRIAGGTAGEMGQQIVEGAGFGDPDTARQRMQQVDQNPAMLAVHNQVQDAHDNMVTLGQQVGSKQSAVSTSAYAYQAALNSFKTGIPSVSTNPDQARELNELKEKIETVKKYVGKGLEWAGKAAEAAGVEGAEKAVPVAEAAADFLTDQFYDARLNEINSKISQYNAAHTEHAITASLDTLRSASRTFTQSVRDFNDAKEAFAHAQETFRDKLRAFGRSADAGGGDKFAQIASVLAEVDTYETQLDDTLRLAYQEQTAAQEAAGARRTAEGGPGVAGGARQGGMPYYEPYRWFHINGDWSYECMQQELSLHSLGTSRGSSQGVANVGVNATVEEAVRTLQGFRAEVDPMRQALARAMDLRMDGGMPTSAAGAAPTQRSANQGL